MQVAPIQWSFSSLKTFGNCALRYYHEKELRDVTSVAGEAATYGKLVHESIEARIVSGTPIPEEYGHVAPYIEAYMSMDGELHAEYDLSLKIDYTPCKASDADVWYKGFADLVVLNEAKQRIYVIDYKTGNPRWADPSQLEIYALALFCHFPWATEVRGMLDFLAQDVKVPKTFKREEFDRMWLNWIAKINRLIHAKERSIWPAKPSGLCKFCPVKTCIENPEWKSAKAIY